ncbi:c-type cytochrome [Aliiglaciecola sp. 2_MG-2023]|uniref:c-type cytochrome n=1 Tax=unclassified Aliiglaciecola TaxID=2593648 RepID=UPI0026E14D86|nr:MULTISPECIES: c-type cytochrome [unclassified Aliiglaciecola]MDO6713142.1 c-type cytochrome [Aliiglaciecola sp. 2_MG-2023]MDO6754184.1 c-type cytochrome [Aliiglaciecola sp. 1_MG-2023]
MKRVTGLIWILLVSFSISFSANAERVYEKQEPPRELTAEQATLAASNYKKYCSLCHGDDREGHKNDHAPSLRSKSLFESGVPHSILRPMSYGRHGTAMGGYLDEVGGPMTLDETWDLTYWLFWQSGAQRVKLSENPVNGDIVKGETIYQQNCTTCHGENGEGVTAPALFNPSFLAHNKDEFIRYAIEKGREDTPMRGFSDKLSETDIDNLTAFIRSKASDAKISKVPLKALPTPDQYVINPQGEDPNFKLDQGKYVSSKDLHAAMQAKKRMVLIDTRVTSVWQRAHLAGSVPFPYYSDIQSRVGEMPKDVLIVGYCSCPRAAAEYVMDKFNQAGYANTAVLYEGIFGWMNLGYPVVRAEGLESFEETPQGH